MKRILLDEGMPPAASGALGELGWDAAHVCEINLKRASDEEILHFARINGRVIVTLDRDFPELAALNHATQPSIILVRAQGLRARDTVDLLREIWTRYEDAIEAGAIVRTGVRGTRIRKLPV